MEWIEMLTRPLTHGTAIAFLGSGCSKAFGLPDWKGLAQRLAQQSIPEISAKQSIRETSAPDLPSLIGHYKRVLGEERYKQVLEDTLKPTNEHLPPEENPYKALLNLRIRRFVTSNYDDLLEKALEEACKAGKRQFNRSEDSFGPGSVAKLCEFVTADPASHHEMVFHCHGRRKLDPLIVTEEDYQECYFGRGDEKMAFRQSLELLYGSNPILFIGTGLNDEDLFRPLRVFGATHRSRRAEQLLFALVPETQNQRIESLYVRYGVKVITYVLGDSKSGAGLTKALNQLQEHWAYYRESWLRKPPFRDFRRTTTNDVRYHGQQTVPDTRKVPLPRSANQVGIAPAVKQSNACAPTGEQPVQSDLDRVKEFLKEKDKPVLCLLGPGGAGKSWLANQMLDEREPKASPTSKSFFWSSYYSGDYLSGLDRALACLENYQSTMPPAHSGPTSPDPIGREKESQHGNELKEKSHRDIRSAGEVESRLSRLERCLQNGSHYLVFDGLERVLRESGTKPDTGIPLNPDIARFFRVICGKHRSKIILTSRLWPETFDEAPYDRAVIGYRLSAATVDEMRRVGWLKRVSTSATANLAALVRLLNGHRYALTLADAWLDQRPQNQEAAATELQLLLARTSPEHRVSRMIELVVQDLGSFEQKLLDHLSICMGAIPPEIVDKCEQLAKPADGSNGSTRVLQDRSLLFCLNDPHDNKELKCIHPIVRGYVFHRRHHANSDELPNFTLPGFTAGGSQVDPGGAKSADEICSVLNKFYDAGRQYLANDREKALAFCRNAFGIVRSRMDANTSSRWDRDQSRRSQGCPGEKHLRSLIQLGDFVKEVSFFPNAPGDPDAKDENAPLWDDELAWLYNEMGLIYYHKGAVLDALGVWQLEHEINCRIDSNSTGGLYLFQSSCNLGAAFIQLGRLQQAETHFRNAARINLRMDDKDHAARILGYRGLIEHLRGNLRAAQKLYRDAIEMLEKIGFNQRGLSIFERHYADLLLKLKEWKDAEQRILSGRARAEAAQYPDIVAHYQLSAGHLHRQNKENGEAMNLYTAALEEAREMGLRGLEADALSELSHLALDVGDTQTAIDRAIESLQIANELCLGLRQTHGLVVLGRALIGSKRPSLGAAYLRHAKDLSERQGYWMRAREADEQLRKLGPEFIREATSSKWNKDLTNEY